MQECDRAIGIDGDASTWRRRCPPPALRSHFHRRCARQPCAIDDSVWPPAHFRGRYDSDPRRTDPRWSPTWRDGRAGRKNVADDAIAVVQTVMRVAGDLGMNRRDVRACLFGVSIAYRKRSRETDLQEREGDREDSESSRPSTRTRGRCLHSEEHVRRAARRSRAIPSDTTPA